MFARPAFLLSWALSALLAVATQFSMWWQLGGDWPRWFRHEPVLSVFSLVLFPIVFAVVMTTLFDLRPRAFRYAADAGWDRGGRRYLAIGLSALALGVTALGVVVDLDRRPFPPFLLSDRTMVEEETALRASILERDQSGIDKALERYRQGQPGGGAVPADGTAGSDPAAAVDGFFAAYPPISGLVDLSRRGSVAAFSVLILNFVNVTIVLGFFLILGFTATCLDEEEVQQRYFRTLLVPATLAMTWFPLRLYAEWYTAFYSLSFLTEYTALFILTLLAAGGLTYLVHLSNPGLTLATYSAVATLVTVGASVAAWWQPDTLAQVRDVMDNFSWVHYLMIFMILTIWAATWCHIGAKAHVKRADARDASAATPTAHV
jgi:hypothetical protein